VFTYNIVSLVFFSFPLTKYEIGVMSCYIRVGSVRNRFKTKPTIDNLGES